MRFAVFGLAASAFWLSFFHRVAPAAISDDLTRAFDLSSAALGTLAATYFYIYTLMQLPTGVLVDTLGPRRVLTVGGLVSGAGSVLLGLAKSFGTAAIGRSLVGLGVSVAFVSMLKLNAVWFDERRFATTVGLSNVIGTSGAVVAAAPLAWLVTIVSWRSVFVGLGALSVAVAVAIWLVVRDRPEPMTVERAEHSDWLRGLSGVVRNRATWPGFWINVGIAGPYLTFVGLWAVPYLQKMHGMTALEATRHTSLMVVALAVSGAALTSLSDRIERRQPILIGAAAIHLACWLAWLGDFASAPGMTYLLSVLTGASAAGFFLGWVCAKEVNAPSFSGIATSFVNIGGFLAVSVLQPAVGWLLDRTARDEAGFRSGILVLTGFAAVGLLATLFVRETRCRNIWMAET